MGAVFFPWVVIESKNIVVSGMQSAGTTYGKPGLLSLFFAGLVAFFSLVPRISFFGSYVRLQGALTFLSYVIIFGAVLTHLRTRRQVDRILHAIIVTSLPIAIYGVIQQAGLDPLPWGGNVTDRVAGNMGNAIFIAFAFVDA